MSPFPSARILPDDWSQHHRDAAEGFLTGTCIAREPGRVADWPDTGVTPGRRLWEGNCSAQALSQAVRPRVVVDSVEVVATHRVSVSIGAPWLPYGTEITVMTNPDDPELNGQSFVVLMGETGTTTWTRDLLCELRDHQPEGG